MAPGGPATRQQRRPGVDILWSRQDRRSARTTDPRPGRSTWDPLLKALDKTLRVLGLFTTVRPEWGLLELSEAADLPISTLHRIVTVLRSYGLITQDPQSRKYRLGYGAIELGRRAAASLPIRRIAEPIMRDLAEATGETIVLTVVSDTRDRAVCIERVESRFDLRLHLEVGELSYLHAGASSKVLLASFTDREFSDLQTRVGFPKLAPRTFTDPDELRRELATIRAQGYAFSREETDVGAWGVSVPILDQGRAIAGLGLACPITRYGEETRARSIELVMDAGRRLTRAMGLTSDDGYPATARSEAGSSTRR